MIHATSELGPKSSPKSTAKPGSLRKYVVKISRAPVQHGIVGRRHLHSSVVQRPWRTWRDCLALFGNFWLVADPADC